MVSVGFVKKRFGFLGQRPFFVKENSQVIFFLDISNPFNYRFNYIG
jgi:hypothetical protein